MKTHFRRVVHLAAIVGIAVAQSVLAFAASAEAGVLDAVRARGKLVCGVGEGSKGFSEVGREGNWSGISVDFCRALAAAVLGNRDAVSFRALAGKEQLLALEAGEIDVLSRQAVMTSSQDTARGIRFPAVLVFGGQGFLVRKSQSVASALELSGAHICVMGDTADAQGIADYFGALKMPFELSRFERWQDAVMAYDNKSCQVLSAELSLLALTRQQHVEPGEHIILPEIATRQFIGPAIRQGDEAWFSVVRWTAHALIAAEELGINGANVDSLKSAGTPEVRRFLATGMDVGHGAGLGADWTQRIVKQVGNYGELYERNLGQKSQLKLDRRLNNLAGNGGLQYAPPFR